MKRWRAGLIMAAGFVFVSFLLTADSGREKASAANRSEGSVFFERNDGQFDDRVRFKAKGTNAYDMYLTDSGAVYVKYGPATREVRTAGQRTGEAPVMVPEKGNAVYMNLVGADRTAVSEGGEVRENRTNYLRPGSETALTVPNFGSVVTRDVYPGVDLVWTGDAGGVGSRFEIEPFADAGQIRWSIDGASDLKIAADGSLEIVTEFGMIRHAPPNANQGSGGARSQIACGYSVEGKTVSLTFANREQSEPLTIEPVVAGANDIAYSTYLGGSDSDSPRDIAVDSSGNSYIVGLSNSADFPTTPGSFDTTWNNQFDVSITKLSASGSSLVWSTYIGGTGSDEAEAIVIDGLGNVFVAGSSNGNYPVTAGAFDTTPNGTFDFFITKLNPSGTTMLFSTLVGGDSVDLARDIAIGPGGTIYVGGEDQGSTNFPLTVGAFDTTNNGGVDGIVLTLSPDGSTLGYSTYIGSLNYDAVWGIAVDSTGNAYLTGPAGDGPPAFPTTVGAFDTTYNGGPNDIFVAKLNASGSALIYSTLIGGDDDENAHEIAIDSAGNAFVTGLTIDGTVDYPTTVGAFDTTHNGNRDLFVTKVNPSGSALVYSTLIGGSGFDEGWALAINSDGKAVVTGKCTPGGVQYPTTPGAFDTTQNGGEDVVVTALAADGSSLLYSTYIGGSGSIEFGYGVKLGSDGYAYIAGQTFSDPFPTTVGAFDTTYNGNFDTFVTKISVGLNAPVRSRSDFDGDGRTDVSVFRPGDGRWYIDASTSGFSAPVYGQSTDRIVPGDFDGDNKTDLALWRPSDTNGQPDFYVLQSSSSTVAGVAWGTTTDVPVVADYNGDARDDFGVWRPSTGVFWVLYQGGGGSSVQQSLGVSTDLPVSADYDGDGKADFAVYRPSNGTWFIVNSSNNSNSSVQWGISTDIPVFADYDGDAKDDVAVFRPSDGVWYVRRSSGGISYVKFGINGDVPVPGDYDGDGKDDQAIYRNGVWYLNRSTLGLEVRTFGLSTDRPTPRYYLPN